MNFSDYYLMHERASFVDFKVAADKFVQQLKEKIQASGVKLNEPIGMDFMGRSIPVMFTNTGTLKHAAKYFQSPQKRISIYLNALLKDRRVKDLRALVLQNFSKIYPYLIHELQHAYDDLNGRWTYSNFGKKPEDYYNDRDELNAFVMQSLSSIIRNPIVKRMVQVGNIGDATKIVFNHLKQDHHVNFDFIFKDNQRWLVKTIYQILQTMHERQNRSE